jgi:hypothetical protein
LSFSLSEISVFANAIDRFAAWYRFWLMAAVVRRD